ncbi:MAG: DUF111 family protein, partial [Bacillota bacterium]|nr:DUF111 family protein [Bacillota bacterium]
MNILYWDAIGGISGDMMTAALLDAAPEAEEYMLGALKRLPLKEWQWQRQEAKKGSFRGKKIDYIAESRQPHRHLPEIEEIIRAAEFPDRVTERILKAFGIMAAAEAKAHGIDINEVHFH